MSEGASGASLKTSSGDSKKSSLFDVKEKPPPGSASVRKLSLVSNHPSIYYLHILACVCVSVGMYASVYIWCGCACVGERE